MSYGRDAHVEMNGGEAATTAEHRHGGGMPAAEKLKTPPDTESADNAPRVTKKLGRSGGSSCWHCISRREPSAPVAPLREGGGAAKRSVDITFAPPTTGPEFAANDLPAIASMTRRGPPGGAYPTGTRKHLLISIFRI
jgi:hypothetical protein